MVRATLEAKFLSRGTVHGDVAWRNIGLYKDQGEDLKVIVLFDLGRVREHADIISNWVDDAIEKLREEA